MYENLEGATVKEANGNLESFPQESVKDILEEIPQRGDRTLLSQAIEEDVN